jgi:hypothetical protein
VDDHCARSLLRRTSTIRRASSETEMPNRTASSLSHFTCGSEKLMRSLVTGLAYPKDMSSQGVTKEI